MGIGLSGAGGIADPQSLERYAVSLGLGGSSQGALEGDRGPYTDTTTLGVSSGTLLKNTT